MSCDRVISSMELRYKQKETGEHDGLCTMCRGLCFDYSPIHEYVGGSDSLMRRIANREDISTMGLGSGDAFFDIFEEYSESWNGSFQQEDLEDE